MGARALAIGAGPEQRASIAAARRLGCAVLALDGRADAEARDEAHDFRQADLMDVDAVIAAARTFSPDFVIPAPLARPLATAGAVNDALGLKGLSGLGGRLATDKRAMRAAFTAAGVPMAEQAEVADAAALHAFAARHGLPVVLKPAGGSGSRGVRLFETARELPGVLSPLPGDGWIAETALQGMELGVDGVKSGGRVHLLALRVKRMTDPPRRQELSYHALDPAGIAQAPRIAELAGQCLQAMDSEDCFFNADMMIAADGAVSVIELAPRPGGNNIFSNILTRAFGLDLLEWFMAALIAGRPAVPPAFRTPAYFEYLPVPAGRVRAVGDLSALAGGPEAVEAVTPLRPGDVLDPVADGASAMARGWMLCETADARRGAQIALDCARIIEMEPLP